MTQSQQNFRKIKFTFPILTLCKGGAQRVLSDIVNGLTRRGHDVTILMPPTGVVEYDVHADIIRTKDITLTASEYPGSDIIVANFFSTVPSALEASQAGKGKLVRFSLCYEPMFLPNQKTSFQSYNETKHLFVISNYQKKLISLIHGIEGTIIPIYVSSTFKNLQIRHTNNTLNITAMMRIPDGGDAWQRDQDYLLQQLQLVQLQYPNIQYNLITPPNELANSPILQRLQASNLFQFHTPANDQELCYLYNKADIFVTSSVFETAVLPGLEAMRCGAALAAVYAGGNTEYCKHEHNCLLSYRYENKLASDIIRLITNKPLRKRLAKQGEHESTIWTIECSISIFEEACRTILS